MDHGYLATRAQDGLNDGLEVAGEFAQKFDRDLIVAIDLAQKMENRELTSTLITMKQDFPAYYATGQKMAKAYIESGPTGGNVMMSLFDATAEQIGNSVDKLLVQVSEIDKKGSQKIHVVSDKAKENTIFDVIVLLIGGAIGLAALAVIAYRGDTVFKTMTNVVNTVETSASEL